MQNVPADTPVLVTTADHPLLTAEIVDRFCGQSLARGIDVTVGLAPYGLVKAAYPDMKKTVLRFRDGDYCGCNLFAFLTAEGRRMADDWRRWKRSARIRPDHPGPRLVGGDPIPDGPADTAERAFIPVTASASQARSGHPAVCGSGGRHRFDCRSRYCAEETFAAAKTS